MKDYSELFTPIKIGKCEIRNRYFMAAMGAVGMADEHGAYTEKAIEYYGQRAKGGTGLIITGVTKVDHTIEAFGTPGIGLLSKNPASFVQSATRMCEKVHAYGSKIFLQLGFGFGRAMVPAAVAMGAGNVAPSEVENRWNPSLLHREMTTEEVKGMIKKMIEGAVIAKMAGFDGVEIHAVHEGYLLDQFTLELFNHRKDEYGGSFENRYRAAVEIVQGIKHVCGQDFPVSLRYTVKSFIKDVRQGAVPNEAFVEKGRDIEEGIKAAKYLEQAGYDALNVDCGTYDSWYWNHPPMYFDEGMYLPYAKMIKDAVNIPVMVAGRMDDPDVALEALQNGSADMIGLARPLLADPDIVEKIRRGKFDRIRPCLSCHDACVNRVEHAVPISCAVNPSCANEKEFALKQAVTPKKVCIVGGGVAGMEAARVLKLRGHEPVLYEASNRLGGSLIPGGMPDFKRYDRKLLAWYETELKALNVEIHLQMPVDETMLKDDAYDAIILATGAKPIELKLPGSEKNHVMGSVEASLHINEVKDKVAIIGAGLVGSELGLWFAQRGKQVTIVEMTNTVFGGEDAMAFPNRDMLKDMLNFHHVQILTETKANHIDEKGLYVITKDGKENLIEADTIVTAIGYRSNKTLEDAVRMLDKDVFILGDEKQVHNIMAAVWDAFEVARNL